jgi:PEP-CTERM motif
VSAPVPEPSAYALMLIGLLAGFGLLHRRRVR